MKYDLFHKHLLILH